MLWCNWSEAVRLWHLPGALKANNHWRSHLSPYFASRKQPVNLVAGLHIEVQARYTIPFFMYVYIYIYIYID